MTTTTAPETVPAKPGQDDDLTHIVCCDDNTALCGLDVGDQPWSDDDDSDECPLCQLAAEKPCARCGTLLLRIVRWFR